MLPSLRLLVHTTQTRLIDAAAKRSGLFTARRYASAVYAMALCLCLSVTVRSSTKMAKRIELVGFLPRVLHRGISSHQKYG